MLDDEIIQLSVNVQHPSNTDMNKLNSLIKENCLFDIDENKVRINPNCGFICGGIENDTGLTGRKIIVDTYGGYCPHGGGAFSGKDPTKVDRSAAYMMRYICKNIVAAGLADKIEAEVSYAIGVAHPVSLCVDTFGTGRISDDDMRALITETFDLRPKAIIDKLGLLAPIYKKTAAYGHFGREGFPWEETDMVKILLQNAEKYLK